MHEFVGLKELYYAGSHGMDIMGPVRQYISDDQPNCVRSTDEQVEPCTTFSPSKHMRCVFCVIKHISLIGFLQNVGQGS